MSENQQILARGAEAILIKQGNNLIKDRIKKGYRLKILDEKLRKSRTKSESKILEKVSKIIAVPKIIETDNKEKIKMQFIEGKRLSDWLDNLKNTDKVCQEIGKQTAALHDYDIIHGDLTTSNMILSEKENKVYFIDFGLGFHSKRIEDKAVDLHLLKQALEAKHFKKWEKLFNEIIKNYNSKDKTKILEQLKKVESRGRYKKNT